MFIYINRNIAATAYSRWEFTFADGCMGKNIIIFGVDISSSVHVDNKNNDIIIIIGDGPKQILDHNTLRGEAK